MSNKNHWTSISLPKKSMLKQLNDADPMEFGAHRSINRGEHHSWTEIQHLKANLKRLEKRVSVVRSKEHLRKE